MCSHSKRMEHQVHGKCSYWVCEREWGCADRVKGEKKKDRNRVVCEFILSSITPITDEYLLSTPLLNAEDAGGPLRKAPINLSLAIYLSVCPFIHQLIWWQSTLSIPLFFCLSSIFQIISPSTHPSVHPSSNSSTHPFISPSFIHLSIIYPSIHPYTHACFHQFPQLHRDCTSVV